MALDWQGPAVTKKLRDAQKKAVNQTMSRAVIHAKTNHAWQNQTGVLEGSIQIVDFAAESGATVRGLWGSQDVRYALIHELGGTIRPKRAKALTFRVGGSFVQVQKVTIPARPYLRPAADVEYPKLAERIRKAFEGRR